MVSASEVLEVPLLHPVFVLSVEQGALMSPNPRGMHEDLAVGCVCVSTSLGIINSLFKMIQG